MDKRQYRPAACTEESAEAEVHSCQHTIPHISSQILVSKPYHFAFARVDMQNKFCVIFFERKIQGSVSAGSYISLEEVILNKSLTRRQANITAERQYHSSLDEYHKSVRIYLVAESLVGTRLLVLAFFCYFIKRVNFF